MGDYGYTYPPGFGDGGRDLRRDVLGGGLDLLGRHAPRGRGAGARFQERDTGPAAAPGILGLLIAFVAAQVWGDVERANTAVNRERPAALRGRRVAVPSFSRREAGPPPRPCSATDPDSRD